MHIARRTKKQIVAGVGAWLPFSVRAFSYCVKFERNTSGKRRDSWRSINSPVNVCKCIRVDNNNGWVPGEDVYDEYYVLLSPASSSLIWKFSAFSIAFLLKVRFLVGCNNGYYIGAIVLEA